MENIQIPVVIAGAGPAGLCMSLLLSRKGIRNMVLEKRERVGTLPRARGINIRSVEILTQLGLAEDLASSSLGPNWVQNFVYTETLAGEIIGRMPGAMAPGVAAGSSPYDYRVAAQDRLDPMLFEHASQHPEAEIKLAHEVTGYSEEEDAVKVHVRKHTGAMQEIRARYLIAADGGGSPLRTLANIGQRGIQNLRSFINVHLKADLSRFTAGREGALIWTLAPGLEGVFQPLDGDKKWAVQIQYDPATDSPEAWSRERVSDRLRAMIGTPEARAVEFDILSVYGYTLSMMIADSFLKGRLLLVGDAAHKIPPYGGFGLNTGIQSAHNLAWKLAAVLRGEASEAIFDSYDSERQEVAARTCAFGRANAGYVEQMMGALHSADNLEERRAAFAASRQYGNWLGLDLGTHYEGPGAYVADAVEPPLVQDPVIDYVPHAKPGWRAPHLWVWKGSERLSLLALFDSDFVLLAGSNGQAWRDAAQAIQRPVHIAAYQVSLGGDLVPEGDDFEAHYQIEPEGAVLVRPDGHVAFRSQAGTVDPAGVLRQVLIQILRKG